MSLSNDQFLRGLAKAAAKPVYLICGQEPLLVQECADALRAKLKADGFSERIVLESDDSGFDWDDLKHLLAVARHGSTLAAARALGVDQSTVQRRLAELERRGLVKSESR